MARRSYSTLAARVLAGGAVLVAGVCTTTMNWRFGHQLGSSEFDGLILGTFSVALDVVKWFALGLAATAWRAKTNFRAAAGLAVWLVAVAYSGAAAIGFSALNRDTTTAGRSQETERIERARIEFKEASAQTSEAKTNARWQATSACSNATAPKSLEFCDRIKELEARAAKASAELDHGKTLAADPQAALIARMSGVPEDQLDHGKTLAADPQAALIARMSGVPEDRVKTALSVAVAAVAEVVAALGLFAVWAPSKEPTPARAEAKKKRRRRATKKSAEVIPFARAGNDN